MEGFVEKPKGKNPLGGPRRRWENNIATDLMLFTPLCIIMSYTE
jgi:hypothetical protein